MLLGSAHQTGPGKPGRAVVELKPVSLVGSPRTPALSGHNMQCVSGRASVQSSIGSGCTARTLAVSGGRHWFLPKPHGSTFELTAARKFESFIGHIHGVHSSRRMDAASLPADSEVTAAWQLLTDFTKGDMRRPPLGQRTWLTSENRLRLKHAVLVSIVTLLCMT